ncbi:putative redox protein [Alkalibacterium subtropicum]|uniref:Putative redox protein n=1 Tax=Alkalibacterium subtropicum TaxID=753702 RepID=A0A1I1GKX6_9LACT|nr:OsmC family protein [Alkalibacterium subtropicum]SFC12224.1 putative redox protein [Alkalibacterium subtropicum]
MKVSTKWEGDMAYTMTNPRGKTMHLDPNGDGVSPMESVLGGLAGCMGIDIVMVLKPYADKIKRLEIDTDGERNDEAPKYFKSVAITINIDGDIPASRVWRAVKLSDQKYCSVANSLNADLSYKVVLNGEDVPDPKK